MKKDKLLRFLKRVDLDFPVPLSAKQDLDALASKLIDKATLCYELDGGEITALVAGYTNDPNKDSAYITIVAVLNEARGKGTGKRLVKSFIDKSAEKGFNSVNLYTTKNNERAIKMYKSLGFVEYKIENEPRPNDLHLIYYIKEN